MTRRHLFRRPIALMAALGLVVSQVVIVAGPAQAAPTWTPQYAPAAANANAVDMVDVSVGYLVGDKGAAWKTVDGGVTVTALSTPTTEHLYGVSLVNASTGYAVGNNGIIIKTTNGGATWTPQSHPGGNVKLTGVSFTDASSGTVVGVGPTILTTTDGGATWVLRSAVTTQLEAVDFPTDNVTGFAVGLGGRVMKTTNGGVSWGGLVSPTTNDLFGIDFVDGTTGYAVGEAGVIYKTTDGASSWAAQTSGTAQHLYGVHFANATTGYAVGANGTLLATTDGGATWGPQSHPGGNAKLTGVDFTDATSGTVVGDGPTILTTTDGGVTWSLLAPAVNSQLEAVDFPTDNVTGFAVGIGGRVMKTINGGVSWGALISPTANDLFGIDFIDGTTGYAVGKSGVIFKTTDGASTWVSQTSGVTEHLYGVHFPTDATTGYATGRAGTILKTTNGGTTWVAQTSTTTKHLYRLYFPTDATTGFAVGESGSILKTTDGGTTWVAQTSGVTKHLRDVSFPTGVTTGYATGQDGTILKTTNGGTAWVDQTTGSDDLFGVSFVDDSTGYTVGQGGAILVTIDGGATWTPQTSNTTEDLFGVTFPVDGSTGFAVGKNGVTPHTTDSGATWLMPTAATNQHLKAVHYSSASVGYATGVNGAIIKTTDGGQSWAAQVSGVTKDLNGVYFADDLTGYAVGETGTVLATTDGGATWGPQTSNTAQHLYGVAFPTDATTGFAVGAAGVTPHTTDSGATWVIPTVATTENLVAVHYPSANVGYATGVNGAIIKTTNGGATWAAQTSGVTKDLNGVYFAGDLIGSTVGQSGTILKTTDGGTTWAAQTSATTQDLFGVTFPVDDSTGFAVGKSGVIVKTTDGGAAWSQQGNPAAATDLTGVDFTTATSGIVIGAGPTILTTVDGGATWLLRSQVVDQMEAVDFPIDNVTGFAVGRGGRLMKTTDGGVSWEALVSPTTSDLFGVDFTDAVTGYAVGQGGIIYKTTDGAGSWAAQTSGTTEHLYGVSLVNASTGYAVGNNGIIIKTTNGGATWTPQSHPGGNVKLTGVSFTDASSGTVVGVGPTILTTTDGGATWVLRSAVTTQLEAVDFPTDNVTGFAVGLGGRVMKTTNGGVSWGGLVSPTTNDLFGIDFVDGTTGYAVGEAGVIYKTTDGASSWAAQTSGTAQHLYGVHFANATTGYAVGANGTLLATTDGGATWGPQSHPGGNAKLTGVDFTDATSGTVVGDGPTILTTTDGGVTWSLLAPAVNSQLEAVDFPTDNVTGFAVGIGGRVMKTINGGVSWGALISPTANDLFGIDFIDGTTGYAVGKSGVIFKTTDGASTWVSQTSGVTEHLYGVHFPTDATTGYATGRAGTILKTTNGGTTWVAQTSTTTKHLYRLYFPTDATTGFAVGESGSILKTTDGGTTWVAQTSGVTKHLRDVSFPTGVTTGYATGQDGTILKTTNGGTAWVDQTTGSDDLFGVSFVDDSTGYTVGQGGAILVTIDGGATWTPQTSNTTEDLFGVTFPVDGSTGFAVGKNGVTPHTTDSGATWLMPTAATNQHLKAVHYSSASVGYATGVNGAIIKTTDGGQSWAAQVSGVTKDLNGVYFADDLTGYAVGETGTVLATTDGGATWGPQTSNTAQHLYGVAFPTDATTGFAVGAAGVTPHTTDSGATWVIPTVATTENLVAVHYPSANVGYATGVNGAIIKTTNGGATWVAQTSGVTKDLNGVYFAGDLIGSTVGQSGTILKTTDGGTTWAAQTSATTQDLFGVTFPVDDSTGFAVGKSGVIPYTVDGGDTWLFPVASDRLYGVSFPIDAGTGYAAGRRGMLLKTANGGASWVGLPSGTTIDLFDVEFPVDAVTGWIVGKGGVIHSTTDGGATWAAEASGTIEDLFAADFFDNSNGWVVGKRGTIVATSNGGSTWASQTSGVTKDLRSVHFPVDSSTGYAAGLSGTILKTTDGGSSWVVQTTPLNEDLFGIHFPVDATTGYAVGKNATIIKTTNGGASWGIIVPPAGTTFLDVHFVDVLNGWAVDSGGVVLATSNGGSSWTTEPSTTTDALNAIDFGNAVQGFAVGDGPLIIARDDPAGNNPPVPDPIGNQTPNEGDLVSLTATATDPEFDGMIWTKDSGPGAVTAGGAYTWTTAEADGPGAYTVTLRVTDDGIPNRFATVSFDVNVAEVNTAPSSNAIADQFPDEGDTVSLTATATDTDVPANSLSWTKDSGPGSVDGSGNYSWVTSEPDGPGTYTVVLRVTDGTDDATVSFDVNVAEVNTAPTDISLVPSDVDENVPVGTVVGTLSTTDPDTGDGHSYLLVAGSGDTDNAKFTIDGSDLKTAVALNYETLGSSLSIRVETTDDGTGNLTFEKALGITLNDVVEATYTISGTVFEDIVGDVLADGAIGGVNNPGAPNVDVHLYVDVDGDGVAEATDTFVVTDTTDVNGDYSFTGQSNGKYFVVVDSLTVQPSGGIDTLGGWLATDVWAEQTYAPAISECADGAGGTADDPTPGPCYGGRRAGVSDSLAIWYSGAEHLAKVGIASGNVSNVDFGFSFNVATTTAGGDGQDDDPAVTLRSVQGSLRQFIYNANATLGTNVMRFVPAGPTNATDGTNDWWRVGATTLLPAITGDGTTVDGRAFDLTDGVTVLDPNTAQIGSGLSVGTAGTYTTPKLDPELEIWNDRGTTVLPTGLVFEADDSVLRHVSIWGFGDAADAFDANVRFGTNFNTDPDFTGSLVEFNVIGTGPASLTDPGATDRSGQANLTMRETDNAIVRDNLIGFAGGTGVNFSSASNSGSVLRNEIRRNGILNPIGNPVGVWVSGTVTGNLVIDNASGIFSGPTSMIQYLDNTITLNGWGTTRPNGIHVYGSSTIIQRNVISDNYGAGVVVQSTVTNSAISRNSFSGNGTGNGQVGIDLLKSGDDPLTAPYVTLNDDGDADLGANNLLNYPVLDQATVVGTDLVVNGWVKAGGGVEFYLANPDPSGFGEGETWLVTMVEGSVDDTDGDPGSYGPGAVNGLLQGEDTTAERFEFTIPVASLAAPVVAGDQLTAMTFSFTTSEFGGNVTVAGPIVVNSTGNLGDLVLGDGVCDTGGTVGVDPECTLRAAIEHANAAAGDDVIHFNIPAGDSGHSGGVWTISPSSSALPPLSTTITIDGTTQTGWTTTPVVEVDGNSLAGTDGLSVTGDNVEIRSLAIGRFDLNAIYVAATAAGTTIAGNHLGTDASGLLDRGNFRGIDLSSGSGPTTVGGTNDADRNVVSGNTDDGMVVWQSSGNTIIGNYFGTDVSGNAPLPNDQDGVALGGTSSNNTIGQVGAGNVFSGNARDGLELDNNLTGNVIQANIIGLGEDGTTVVANGRHGLVLYDGVNNTLVGGTGVGEGNVISGNTETGVIVDANGNAATTANTIAGNYIGTDAGGTLDKGNGSHGIHLFSGATGNTTSGNLISGNTADGVRIIGAGSDGNTVTDNYIGTNAAGTAKLANGDSGVDVLNGASGNFIGLAGAGNLISGNNGYGVDISGVGTDANTVAGNNIGTDAAGTADLGNATDGVAIRSGAQSNTVGGVTAAHRNIISGNDNDGIWITGSGTDSNVVQGNWIGFGSDGSSIGNSFHGVAVENDASYNLVGGTLAAHANRIGNSAWDGVAIAGGTGTGNAVIGNSIVDNTGLGIDFENDGITPNDLIPGDGDSGPNGLLNFPEILSATESGGTVTLTGVFDVPQGEYRIEFFKNPSGADPSGNGEGEAIAGSAPLSHTAFVGDEPWGATFSGVTGDIITATITECTDAGCTAFLSTSEFSAAVTVTSVNTPPVANDNANGVAEDGSAVFNVKANDTDAEDGIPSGPAAVVAQPLHGTAVANAGGMGTITYTPDPDFFGSDTLTYTIDDSGGLTSNVATVTITVAGSDDPPTAADDGPYSVLEDGSLVVGAQDRQFSLSWGSAGAGNGQFAAERGIAVAPDGSIYVADTGNDRVQKFDAAGTYLLQWGSSGTGNGQFDTPMGVAVAPDGTVYVSDLFNDRIQYFDPTGVYLGQFGSTGTGNGQLDSPRGIDFGPDGNLYVADAYNYRIQVFTPSGTYLRQWGSSGTGNGQFDAPRDLGVDALGDVYVADSFNDRIQKFDSSGTYLLQWGTPGAADGEFDFPRSIEVNADGNIFVSDSFNDRVQIFDSTGTFLSAFGTSGTGDGQFAATYGLAFSPNGDLYVVDVGNNRVQRFAPIGILGNDTDPDFPLDTLTATVDTDVTNGTLALAPDGTFTYTPDPDYFGPDSFVYQVCDTSPACDTATVTITVGPVNDEPSFTPGVNIGLSEDNGAVTIPGWATAISAGPANESGQSLTFNITANTNPGLFSTGPAIDSATGNLSFTPAAQAFGAADITVALQDNGGTTDGGDDTSASAVFTITVTSVNDAPSFTAGGAPTVDEDSGPYSAGWASAISAGPANESGQTVSFNLTGNTNPGLFSVAPAVDGSGNLTFTPAPNAFGTSDITVEAQDDGGTAGGGVDTSPPVVVTITVDSVNDAPAFTPGGNVGFGEDNGPTTVAGWASLISPGPANEAAQILTFNTTGNTNPGLFSVAPTLDPMTGDLTFTPAADQNGSAVITVELQDNGGTANGGADTSAPVNFTITINPQNDAPVLDPVGAQSGDEGTLIGFTATASDSDVPANTLTFTLEDGAGSVPAGASITAGGVFTWTPTEVQGPGVYSFDVVVTDDGTPNEEDREAISVTVGEVNGTPALTDPGDQVSAEGEAVSLAVVASDPDLPENLFSFNATGLPPGLSIDGGSGTITGIVGAGAAAGSPYSVTINVDDDGSPVLGDSIAFTWTVNANTLSVSKTSDGGGVVLEGDTVTYTIDATNVGGAQQTNVTVTDPLPAGTTFVSSQVESTASETFRDEFSALNYSGNNGSQNWTGAWQELGEGDGATSGRVRVVASTRCAAANCFRIGGDEVSITGRGVLREADLSAANTATLRLSSRRQRLDDSGGTVSLEISASGGTSWDVLKTWTLNASDSAQTVDQFDITGYRAVDTLIRLVGSGQTESYLYVDDIEISAESTSTVPGGAPPTLTSGHVLDPGESLTVTLVVAVADPVADAITQIDNTATATSNEGASASDIASDSVNFRPRVTNPGNQSGPEGTPVSVFVPAYDPGGDTLTWSQSGLPDGLSINSGTGEISGTPTFTSAGSYTVTITVTDDGTPNLTTNVVFDWDIANTNRSPVADPIADQFPAEGSVVSLVATATDPDLPADTLSWSLDSGPGAVGAGGAYMWVTTEADGPGVYLVVLRVSDAGGPILSDTASFTITVGEVNVAPVLDPVGAQSGDEGTLIGFTATATDGDVPGSVTFTLEDGAGSVPAGASITAGGVFTWTPAEAQGPGVYSFDVVVTDNTLLEDRETITVTVSEANTAPVLDPVGAQSGDEGTLIGFTATATDGDVPGSVTFTLEDGAGSVPAGASINAGGVFTWTPAEVQGPGVYTFDVVVTDNTLLEDRETITVTVDEVNNAPVLDPVGAQSGDEGTLIGFTATATDGDVPANALTFTLEDGAGSVPAGASITAGGALTWIPTETQGPGVYSFDVVVTDDGTGLLEDRETITVTVDEVNNAPVLDPVGAQSGDEGTLIGFTATATDGDVPTNAVTFTLEDGAGSIPPGAAITAGGVFTFTPSEAQGPAVYSFDVVVTDDGTGLLDDRETITVTVNEVNVTPVLDPVGAQSGDEGTLIGFTATATDGDVPGSVTFTLEDGAGSVPAGASINAGGVFTWTPAEAQGPGVYTFDVVVTDNTLLEDRETITVTVNEANTAPILNPLPSPTQSENTLIAFTASATDGDLPANGLSYSLVGAPPGATINPTSGAFGWIPTETQGPGVYTFDVVVTDDGAPNLTDTDSVTIMVVESNRDPVLDPVGAQSGDEGTLITFSATATDLDQPANLLTFTLEDGPGAVPPGASITAGGVFTWTPAEAQGPGVYTFDVVLTDDGDPIAEDRETITVTVGEVNLAPSLNPIGPQAGDEGTAIGFTATASDPDLPPETLTFTLGGAPAGAAITAGGVFGWIPSETQGPGVYVFDVIVTDDGTPNLEDRETITVTVGEVDTAPTLNPVGDRLVDEGSVLVFSVTSSDLDLPNSRTYSLEDGPGLVPSGAGIDPVLGLFGWSPTEAQGPGVYTFDVVVTDNTGLQDRESITVTVAEINQAPVLDPVGDRSAIEQVPLTFSATASDPDDPANTLTFSLSGGPAGAAITSGGAFSWTPTEAQGPGTFTFDVVVADDGTPASADSETITVTVGEVNAAPVLSPIGDRVVDEEALVAFVAVATDPDVPADTLSYSLAGAPAGASIDPAVGAFSWTPTEAQGPGTYSFTFIVVDAFGASDTETVTMSVAEVNLAPTILDPGDQTGGEGSPVTLALVGADADEPANLLSWSVTGLPGGLSIDPVTGVISGIVTEGAAEGSPFAVTIDLADDGTPPLVGTTSFAWAVAVNRPPTASPDFYEVEPGATLIIGAPGVLGNDVDPDGDILAANLLVPPSAGALAFSPTGGFTYIHNGGGTVEDVFVYEVDDGRGGLSLATVKISILETNLPPTLTDDRLSILEDTVGSIAPLVNDSDPNGDPLTLIDFTQPEFGLLSASADGTLAFTPPGDFFGEVTSVYTASDGKGGTATGVLSIVVAPVNDLPIGRRDVATLDTYLPFVLDVLGNDGDVDSDVLRVAGVLGVTVGQVVVNPDGTLTYRPATGFVGTETFQYQVSDGAGGFDTVSVSITVPEEVLTVAIARGEDIGTPSLGFQAPDADLGEGPSITFGLAQGVSLLADAFFQSLGALRLPILFLGLALGTVVVLGGFTELPMLLATRRRRYYSAVLLGREDRLAARVDADPEEAAVYFYEPTAAGFQSLDKPVRRDSGSWIPVESPNGAGWVEARYLTETVDLEFFLEDERPVAMLRRLAHDLLGRKDISSLFSSRGLALALGNDPEIFESEAFEAALADRYGSEDSSRLWETALEPLGAALRAADDLDLRSSHSRAALIPVELWNFQYLTVNVAGHPPWLVYFEYAKGRPRIVGIGLDV